MTHSGERFARCIHCGAKIRQRQTMGIWKHWVLDKARCYSMPGSTFATPPEPIHSEETK